VLTVKANQPALLGDAKAAIQAALSAARKIRHHEGCAHGPRSGGTALVAPVKDMAQKHDFPRLRAVARIPASAPNDDTVERYFLMSQDYSPKRSPAHSYARTETIENGLHWPLDVVLDEDLARNRKDNAPANLASRRLALNGRPRSSRHKTSLRAKLNAQAGTTPSSSNSSDTCDSPAI